ncbi:MAG: sigma-54-dependent Fis family transcriptional regulator [FCB group bacterium]|nr:sigma-54-dependent Fis family transcriptional regulator [FCB group bacterium]
MILVIDDEKYIRSSLVGLLGDEGYRAEAVETAEAGEKMLDKEDIELILLDIQMPGKDGISFLADNHDRLAGLPVIVISGRGDIPTAVSAIKLGAFDYIEKPLLPQRVLLTVKQALRFSNTVKREGKLVGHILDKYRIIGRSQAVVRLQEMISKAAASDSTVLITGETGTGKELVARHLHYLSLRKAEPLVVVNCPAIPETLFESELFGHVQGAFTGAHKDRNGRFEQAGSGTLFLDEIGEIPITLQGKLLRVLEYGQFEKLGAEQTLTAACRLVVATNRDLLGMAGEGEFREDLLYRLNVIAINVPPLRDRLEDIPLLIACFMSMREAGELYELSSEAMGMAASFEWPGNIRQLKNFVDQLLFECDPGVIGPDDIRRVYRSRQNYSPAANSSGENRLNAAVRQFETGYLSQLFLKHKGNIAAMSRELGMDRGNLSKKLKLFGIV